MYFHRITHADDPLLAPLWTIYEASFPEIERRILKDHLLALQNPALDFRAIMEDAAVIGMLGIWQLQPMRYVEYFATDPALRGNGKGRQALQQFMDESTSPVVLEIEPPEDDITRRRLGFYQRLGFVPHEGIHQHPPYQRGHTPHPLVPLSLHRPMTPDERASFEQQLATQVMQYSQG